MHKWTEEELEFVPCDFCAQQEARPAYKRRDGMSVVECPLCGLAYLNPRPRSELIHRFYEKAYFDGTAKLNGDGGLQVKADNIEDQTGKVKVINRRLSLIEEQIGDIQGKKILEVGCATGDMLYALKSRGANVYGIEISRYATDIACERGFNVICGEVEDYAVGRNESFDVVIAYEVIEHVKSPARFLKTLANLIKPDGLIVLDTPNFGCAKRFGDNWFGFQTSFEHLYFFSLESLGRYARNTGLNIVYWETNLDNGIYPRSDSLQDRFCNRINKFFLLLAVIGIFRLFEIFKRRESLFHPYGDGHTLQVAMKKTITK